MLGSIQEATNAIPRSLPGSADCGPSSHTGSTSRRPPARCNSNSQLSGHGNQPHAATSHPQLLHLEIPKRPGVTSRAKLLAVREAEPISRRQRPCAAPSWAPEDWKPSLSKPAVPNFLSLTPAISSQRQLPPPPRPHRNCPTAAALTMKTTVTSSSASIISALTT